LIRQKKLCFTRTDVLEKLWTRANWIEKKINNRQTQFTKKLKERTYLVEKERRLYQSILSGLQNEELELRIIELEEKLKNCVLIPKEENR